MHKQDTIYLDQLCPKINNKNWRDSLQKITKYKCIYWKTSIYDLSYQYQRW